MSMVFYIHVQKTVKHRFKYQLTPPKFDSES